MNRRTLLRATVAGTGAMALPFTAWPAAYGAPARAATGPYGRLRPADEHGIRLPAGFTSTVIARSDRVVSGTGYMWHRSPDGGAVIPDGSGWVYVSNSETSAEKGGGASRIVFDRHGSITGASRILGGTDQNCAGGSTPWRTWLSCEEVHRGRVYETYPLGGIARVRPALGRFKHEAAAADPVREVIYLTEDEPDGRFYRFVPDTWGDLSTGRLQVMRAGPGSAGSFTWADVPDPAGSPTVVREQVRGSKVFRGGEGCHYASGTVWFTTKGDGRVWQVDPDRKLYALAYDHHRAPTGAAVLTGADNLTSTAAGDLYVAEDSGSMDICLITPDHEVSVFLRVTGHPESEVTGPAFTPGGDRLYFSSQRGPTGSARDGVTYCVTGPFRR